VQGVIKKWVGGARVPVIDLNVWHHAIHQVTGAMALRFNRATPADLQTWACQLRAVAEAMESQSNSQSNCDTNCKPLKL
jgi:hypothetical protein